MTLHSIIDQFDLLMDAPDSVSKLRQFILQLAVQGRLTEQDPSDEPADQLLERIQAEKQRLYDEGEIRKPKTIKDVKGQTSWSGLPSKWTLVGLGEIIEASRNGFSKRSGESGQKTVVLRLSDISQNEVVFDDLREIRMTASEVDKYKLDEGDILVIRVNGSSSLVAQPVVIRHKDDHCFCDHFIRVSPCRNLTDPEYIALAVRSRQFRSLVENEFVTTAGQKTISQTRLLSLAIPLPPLEEQQRIVATVDRLMDECDTLEAQQDAAEQVRVRCTEAATHALQTADTPAAVRIAWHRLRDHFDALCATPDDVDAVRQTILQLAVQGKLTEQDPSDEPADQLLQRITSTMQSLDESGEIWRWKKMPEVSENEKDFALPDGWAWTRLGNLLNISSGDGLTSKEMSGGKIPVYGGNGITGYHEAHNVDRTRIVIGRVGFHCGSVHLTNGRAWVTDNAFVTTYPEQSIDQAFLIWLLKATDLQQNQSSTAQPVISGKKVYPIVVALPPLEEQQRIVATVDRLMDECDTLEAQLSRQQALGAELLDAVLHGAAHSEGQPAMQEAMTAG